MALGGIMTLTGHWNRAWEKPFNKTREELVRAIQEWEDVSDRHANAVNAYTEAGGRVNDSRVSAFQTIVRLNLRELRSMKGMRDSLAAATA
jgi:hypothetical protein